MKKLMVLIYVIVLQSCSDQEKNDVTGTVETPPVITDTVTEEPVKKKPEIISPEEDAVPEKPAVKETKPYSNQVFRDIKVSTAGDGQYRVTGQAQVFEASFSWVVEDGHHQLLKGHDMTDNGAPEWGKLDFSFKLPKVDPHTTPHLIMLVYSAKDGSPQHELPIPLP